MSISKVTEPLKPDFSGLEAAMMGVQMDPSRRLEKPKYNPAPESPRQSKEISHKSMHQDKVYPARRVAGGFEYGGVRYLANPGAGTIHAVHLETDEFVEIKAADFQLRMVAILQQHDRIDKMIEECGSIARQGVLRERRDAYRSVLTLGAELYKKITQKFDPYNAKHREHLSKHKSKTKFRGM
jgi:hypothetical protein